MWKGEFIDASAPLLVGPKRKKGADDDDDAGDSVSSDKSAHKIDLSLAKPAKRKKNSRFESFLLQQDSALQLAFRPLENNANMALNIKRLSALGSLEPWRFHNIEATTTNVEGSVAAFLFTDNASPSIVDTLVDNFGVISSSDSNGKSPFSSLLWTKIFKYELTSRYATNREAFQRAALWLVLAHFHADDDVKNLLRTWKAKIARGAVDGKYIFDKTNNYEDIVQVQQFFGLLDREEETLGIVRWFDTSRWLSELAKATILAFLDDKTRAAACSADKATHALCRAQRGKIAEIQFVYRFEKEPAYEEKLRSMRQKMFGGPAWGTGQSWGEFYRACVVAHRVMQENRTFLQGATEDRNEAVRDMWQMFSRQSAAQRLNLRFNAANPNEDEISPEDRRFRTARVLIWMLFDAGFEEAAHLAFRFSFGLIEYSSFGEYAPEDIVNDDGTLYDGTRLVDKLALIARPVISQGSIRVSLPTVRIAYAQDSTRALWFPVGPFAGDDVVTFLHLAFIERDDFTPDEKALLSKSVAHSLAEEVNRERFEIAEAVLARTRNIEMWMYMMPRLNFVRTKSAAREATLIISILSTMTDDDKARYVVELDDIMKFLSRLIGEVMKSVPLQTEKLVSFYDAMPTVLLWMRAVSNVASYAQGRASAAALYQERSAVMPPVLKQRIEAFGVPVPVDDANDSDSD